MVIHVTPRPLFQILPTQHVITLTNLACRIGLIRINTCPVLILWTRLEQSSLLVTESMGIQLPRCQPPSTSSFIYSFSWTIIRRINWLKKEDGSFRRAWATNSNFRRLKIPSKFSSHSPYSIFQGEHANLEKSMKFMIQSQNDPLDMIEVRLSRLENMRTKYGSSPYPIFDYSRHF